ncbi:hypothetical protein E2C01_100753 [Portunus trituberculatus]|uniref:Uncharacterized protein n=1 Tax=Portunus trituberculatus TaxID=210409 RepID=A0A5B7K8V6_PORTR|nr:hypothetical protein [Portunus trituberculatus]
MVVVVVVVEEEEEEEARDRSPSRPALVLAACRPCTRRPKEGEVPLAAVAVREEQRTKLGHAPLHRPPPPPLPPPPTAAGTVVSLRPSFPPSVMHQQQRQEASRYPLLGHHNTLCGLKPVVFHPFPQCPAPSLSAFS